MVLCHQCGAAGGIVNPGLAMCPYGRQIPCMNLQAPTPFPGPSRQDAVAFDRRELSIIMTLYGRMVAAGEWRDYGMSFLRDVAVFSIFRRTAETPLYRIEKRPKMRARQGLYALLGMNGQVLRRGQDLRSVLTPLERKLIRPVDD
jgi:hypothetical protein